MLGTLDFTCSELALGCLQFSIEDSLGYDTGNYSNYYYSVNLHPDKFMAWKKT